MKRQTDMLSCHRVGHCKLAAAVILNERIEAARVHLRLKYDFTVRNIIGIDTEDSDMLAVDRRMEEIQPAVILDEIRARLTVRHNDRLFPAAVYKVIDGQKAVGAAALLTDEIIASVADDIGGVLPFQLIRKIRLGYILPGNKVAALDYAGEISAVCAGVIIGFAVFDPA